MTRKERKEKWRNRFRRVRWLLEHGGTLRDERKDAACELCGRPVSRAGQRLHKGRAVCFRHAFELIE